MRVLREERNGANRVLWGNEEFPEPMVWKRDWKVCRESLKYKEARDGRWRRPMGVWDAETTCRMRGCLLSGVAQHQTQERRRPAGGQHQQPVWTPRTDGRVNQLQVYGLSWHCSSSNLFVFKATGVLLKFSGLQIRGEKISCNPEVLLGFCSSCKYFNHIL